MRGRNLAGVYRTQRKDDTAAHATNDSTNKEHGIIDSSGLEHDANNVEVAEPLYCLYAAVLVRNIPVEKVAHCTGCIIGCVECSDCV